MSDGTKIEWSDTTWNPVTGCTKVSSGCKNCYAERVFPRPYPGRAFTDVRSHPDRLVQPLRWRKPRRVFVNSMSDLFHEHVPDEFIAMVWAVMAAAKNHTFQILTKRHDRMRDYLLWLGRNVDAILASGEEIGCPSVFELPLPNVHLGVSCEDQKTADERTPPLLQTPAAVRLVSAEPLLDGVDLSPYLHGHEDHGTPFEGAPHVGGCVSYTPPLDWVIVGGESGSGARPCHIDWIRSIQGQCRTAGVPCFVKQLGTDPRWNADYWTVDLQDRKGGDPEEWPEDLRVREFPDHTRGA